MPPSYSREAQDALQALDRLVQRHKLLSLEQGKSAARLIAGDENVEFPLPRPPPPAPPAARAPPPKPESAPAAPPAEATAEAPPASDAKGEEGAAPDEAPTTPASEGSSPPS